MFLGLNHGMSPESKRQFLVNNPRILGAWSLAHSPWPLVPGAWSLGLRLLVTVPGFGCLSRFLSLFSGSSCLLGFRWALEEIGGVVDAGQDAFFRFDFQTGPKIKFNLSNSVRVCLIVYLFNVIFCRDGFQ